MRTIGVVLVGLLALSAAGCGSAETEGPAPSTDSTASTTARSSGGSTGSPQATRQAALDVVKLLGDTTAELVGGGLKPGSGSFLACPIGGYQYSAQVLLSGFHYGTDEAAVSTETAGLRKALTGAGYTTADTPAPGAIVLAKDGLRVAVGAPPSRVVTGAPTTAFRTLDVTSACTQWSGADKSYVEQQLSAGVGADDDFAEIASEVAQRSH